MFQPMDYDYNKRNHLLPEGCKDLGDVIQPRTAVTERGFELTVQLSVLTVAEIQILADRSTLQIFTRHYGSRTIEVPGAYPLAGARATYFNGRLHILVPKAGFNTAPESN
jgi:hypothetical protein